MLGDIETNMIGFLPSWARSLVAKIDQYANKCKKAVCMITGECKVARPSLEMLRKQILQDEERVPRRWKGIPREV